MSEKQLKALVAAVLLALMLSISQPTFAAAPAAPATTCSSTAGGC